MGNLPRRMPGAARCQLCLFQKDGIAAPAFVAKVIGKANTHDATTDDDNTSR